MPASEPPRERPRGRAVRRLYGALLHLRYRALQSHRHRRVVLERPGGLEILVLPEVFNPALFRTGPFFVESLQREVDEGDGPVLELGTGTGIGALAMARRGHRVVATDVSADAVRCARVNSLLHRLEERIDVREGDLFAPVEGERFPTIVFHPPFWAGEPRNPSEVAFRAGDLAHRFAMGLADHLAPGGAAFLLLSTDGLGAGFLERLAGHGFVVEARRRRDLWNEVLTLYRVRARPSE